jgi:signal transduction histidine kinase
MIRNLPIRTKLFAILVAPLVALTILASIGIGTSLARKVQAEQLTEEATFAVNLAQLVHELQQERDLSAGWVAGRGDVGRQDAVIDQRKAVDKVLASIRKDVKRLEVKESPVQDTIALALPELNNLDEGRQKIDSSGMTVTGTLDYYSGIINRLLAVDHQLASQTNDQALVGRVSTFASLARLKESTSLERGLLNAVAASGRFGPGEFRLLPTIVGAQQAWRSQFDATASPAQRAALDQVRDSVEARQASELRDAVLTSDPDAPVDLDPDQWYRYTTVKMDLLRQVEQNVAADVTAGSQAVQSSASRQALIYTLILTLVLWLTVGLSFLMSRSMVRPLQGLTRTANEVADQRLPGLVDQLQHTKDPRDLDVVPEPVPVTSGDEIGQVSAAFNSVHRVAIQVATEQAALRRSIGDMFINLARRSQTLIDRQLELLEDLERSEADPETLENLFKLDHMATRMRRNAEDLIVLSDSEPGRHWVQPMTLIDVARAAAAEVEQYQRVEFLPMVDLQVAGHAAVDVVHLLAELIENATAFSPPNTKVQIAGQAVPHGYVVEIEDRGLGMSDEELVEANRRLANPPEIDFALSRMLGLYVVGRLAQRYNIKVQLRHSWYGGITALTLLPHDLLVWPQMTQAVPEGSSLAGRAELLPPEREAALDGQAGHERGVESGPTPSADHLPIFEAARSDWFVTEPPRQHRRTTADPPHRPDGRPPISPVEEPSRAPADAPAPFQPPAPPAADELPPHRSEPVRAFDEEAPLYQAERARLRNEPPPYRPAPPPPAVEEPQFRPVGAPVAEAMPPSSPTAAPPAAGPGSPTTQAGLPRRVPRANLSPGMATSQQATGQPSPGQPPGRSPDEVRSMLSSYRTGIERGRTVAGGSDRRERPPDAP